MHIIILIVPRRYWGELLTLLNPVIKNLHNHKTEYETFETLIPTYSFLQKPKTFQKIVIKGGCTELLLLDFFTLPLTAWLHSEKLYFYPYSISKDVITQV